MSENLILLAQIVSIRGLKGEVKIKTFSNNPLDIKNYNLFLENGNKLSIVSCFLQKDILVAKLKGVSSIEQAEVFKGEKIYTTRDSLPATNGDDDFYHVDLVGMKVLDCQRNHIGEIDSVHNFGAGDLIEVRYLDNSLEMIPFKKELVSVINLEEKYIVLENIVYV